MWYNPTKVECRKCKRFLNQQEFTWVEQTSKWNRTCLDCDNEKARSKRSDEVNFIGRPRGSVKKYVKNAWLDSIITLSDRKIEGKDISEKDIKQIIDEGYFFILRNY